MGKLLPLCLLAASAALGPAPAALAVTLGVIGKTYPIAEPHLLEEIEARLREKERSGELARLQEQLQERARQRMLSPPAVEGLQTASERRTFFLDPTYTLDRNITDERGTVLFAAGTRTNPLQILPLSRHLLFFDARDERQVELARRLIASYEGRVKPILVAGSFVDLMQRWQRPVYYDQAGRLVHRLGIARVPALVSQDGLRLRVDEVPAN